MTGDNLKKFARERMKEQGEQIRRWAADGSNPEFAAFCLELMAAAEVKN